MSLNRILFDVRHGDNDATVILIKRFRGPLYDCANRLQIDDAYDDLIAELIQLIIIAKPEVFENRSDGEIYNYFKKALSHSCDKMLRRKIDQTGEILFADLSDSELVNLDNKTAEEDIYFRDDLLTPLDVLTPKERQLLHMRYLQHISITEIAVKWKVSRQNVNQMKKKALLKLGQAIAASDASERKKIT